MNINIPTGIENIEGNADKITLNIDDKIKELKNGLSVRNLEDRSKMGSINDLKRSIKYLIDDFNDNILLSVNEKKENGKLSPDAESKLDDAVSKLSIDLGNKINDLLNDLDITLKDKSVFYELTDVRSNSNFDKILSGIKHYEETKMKVVKSELISNDHGGFASALNKHGSMGKMIMSIFDN